MKKIIILSFFFSLCCTGQVRTESLITYNSDDKTCSFSGLLWPVDKQIGKLIEKFTKINEAANYGIITSGFINRYIFFGSPGNGKTFLAGQIANHTDSEFIVLDAPNLVDKYQGSGAEKIKTTFQDIVKITAAGKQVVLFIDEIDAIVSKNVSSNQHDTQNAMQSLWIELLRHEKNKKLLIIVATNNAENFNDAFDNRFPRQNLIELINPDLELRKQIIQATYRTCNKPKIDLYELYQQKNKIDPGLYNRYKIALKPLTITLEVLDILTQYFFCRH